MINKQVETGTMSKRMGASIIKESTESPIASTFPGIHGQTVYAYSPEAEEFPEDVPLPCINPSRVN